MAEVFQITLTSGIPTSGDGEAKTINALMADGGQATLGRTTDVADSRTDASSVSAISLFKQISASVQLFARALPTALGIGGGLRIDGSGVPLPVTLSSVPSHAVTNSGFFPVQLKSGKTSSANFNSGTTAYVPNDVVASSLTFSNAASTAEDIMIDSASLRIDRAGIISGETTYRLALFSAAPASALSDSANWIFPSGDRVSFLGFISFGAIVDEGDTCYVEVNNLNKRVNTASTSLFAYLLVGGTYTPSVANHTVIIRTRSV